MGVRPEGKSKRGICPAWIFSICNVGLFIVLGFKNELP